jgi:hypothetical protein
LLADALPNLFPEIRERKKRAFLMLYTNYGTLNRTAVEAHVDLRYHWLWMREDPVYAAAFAEAQKIGADLAEDTAYRIAIHGYERGVWYQGKRVGSETMYLPTMTLGVLNAAKPDKYKYRQEVEHTISPSLAALQQQWQVAAQQQSLPPAPQAIEAEYTPLDAAPPLDPIDRETYRLLDALNRQEPDDEP